MVPHAQRGNILGHNLPRVRASVLLQDVFRKEVANRASLNMFGVGPKLTCGRLGGMSGFGG